MGYKKLYQDQKGKSRTSLNKWRAAVARARDGGAVAKLHCYGSSTTYSLFSNDPVQTNSYPQRMRALMHASGLFGGVYEGHAFLTKYQATSPASATKFDTRFTLGANWVSDPNGFGLGKFAIGNSSNAGDLLTFASGVNCTGFTVTYLRNTSFGSFDWAVDGGAYTTVATGGANAVGTLTISGLSSSSNHTLDIKFNGTGTGTRVLIQSVKINDSTRTGQVVEVANCGINNSNSTDWTYTNGGHPSNSLELAWTYYSPDLAILQLGLNDANTGVSAATFYSNYTTWVQKAKSVNCDVIIMIPHPFDSVSLPTAAAVWSQYVDTLYRIALENDCFVIDMGDQWPAYSVGSVSPYSWYSDGSHATSKGYWDIARAAFEALKLNF